LPKGGRKIAYTISVRRTIGTKKSRRKKGSGGKGQWGERESITW